ncbi:PPE domain-containing protein [Mycobacteroides sp. LB1]|uniref:PPE domain-containing protein n=1 Tax=Mycobacteroides sp. LB1 TaxID=2750814 RepID=UPI0015DEC1AA|nr:PPE domain-containing protein [Mycobacteroides sp. LB1]
MGFTNVVWEARSTEQLARDLTEGAGPTSMGEAGAAWVRIANAHATASEDYKKILDTLRAAWSSDGSNAVISRLEAMVEWLSATALNSAANGQRAEEAAVANTVAVLAMPSVTEAVESRARHDMMASLEAYNGAVLSGTFAEFDENATTDLANAALVMTQYEEAVTPLAEPWEEPPPPQVVNGDALRAEKDAKEAAGKAASGRGAGGMGGAPMAPTALQARQDRAVQASKTPAQLQRVGFGGGAGGAGAMGSGMGGSPYAPMTGAGRGGDHDREFDSVRPASTLQGAGEAGAGLSSGGPGWLPAAAQNDSPFQVSNVSWSPTSSVFDELAVPAEPAPAPWDSSEPERTLEPVSDRWVSPAVIGGDKESA